MCSYAMTATRTSCEAFRIVELDGYEEQQLLQHITSHIVATQDEITISS